MSVENLTVTLAELVVNPAFLKDTKWQARVKKAMIPLDLEERIKSQLYTAARKELDTEAMTKFRRTGNLEPVSEEDIEVLFNEKYNDYLNKKAEKAAKAMALSKAE